jgi:hypothetical protein
VKEKTMKMLMIIGPESRREELQRIIASHGVHAYSELTGVLGEGETGKHFATHAWPGQSVLIFTVIPKEQADALVEALRAFKAKLYQGEGIRVFAMSADMLL